jgi:hypothetical protein
MTDEERSWRNAFQKIGPELLRMQLPQLGFSEPSAKCAVRWLLEQEAASDLRETMRFETIKRWNVAAAIAGIVAAFA